MPKKRRETPKPIDIAPMKLLALVVCEQILKNETSDHWSLIGLRDEFIADQFPFVMRTGEIFFGYTGVRQGEIDLLIRLVDADDANAVIRYAAITVTGGSPVGNGAARVPLDGATVPKPGVYFAEVTANGHEIGRRRIEFKPRT